MFFDDLNHPDETKAVSPLKHDYEGRFSRKGKKVEPKVKDSTWLDSILIVIFGICLFATDFILFAGSGNIEVFYRSLLPIPEVLFCILFFALIISGIVALLHRKAQLKYIFAAFMAFAFTYILFTQFSQMQQNITIGTVRIQTHYILGLILAAVVYAVYAQDKPIYKGLLTIASVILLANVYVSYMRQSEPQEFLESYNTQKLSVDTNKRFIYFLLPNLVSYPYLNGMNIPEAQHTKQIMQGFYQKNNFKLYPQAYAPEQEYLNNMILSFNPVSGKKCNEHILNTRILSEYWRFNNLRTEYIYLKNNQLYDVFKRNKFQISAYKSRDFDMCHAEHKYNVNRCIEKINQPTNIYSMTLSTFAKTKILLVEWLSSLHLFSDMTSIYRTLDSVINADKVPMVGINYNNLYVVNSIKTFDILLDDIKKDSGRQAYFVFADIPSNMYIYDEYCRLKPQEEWLDMANLPWIKNDYTLERQKAYLQQTLCLYGKLEEFIDNLRKHNLWEDTIMVVQGTSGVNDFRNKKYPEFIDNFMANRLVNMAIHDKYMQKYEVDMGFCPTNNILIQYLFQPNKTCRPAKLEIHNSVYTTLRKKLKYLTGNIEADYIADFDNWYNKWQQENNLSEEQSIEIEHLDIDADIEEDFGLTDIAEENKRNIME